jgi:hypothetical protein
LAQSRCCFVQAIEIAKVLPRFADDAGIIVIFRQLMPGDHRLGPQGLEHILISFILVAFSEELA